MAEEKTRVDFNAPASLVEQADAIADLLGVSRTQLLVDALRDEIDDLAADEGFRRRLESAYYDGRIEFEVVESVLGTDAAMRTKLLRESLDREPPEPRLDGDLPTDAAFYDGDRPTWAPEADDEGADDTDDADKTETDT
jgi:plasmid stabilization system protein ParE